MSDRKVKPMTGEWLVETTKRLSADGPEMDMPMIGKPMRAEMNGGQTVMNNRDLVKTSKKLSKMLRHDPTSFGVNMTSEGWAPVTEVLRALNIDRIELDMIVAENNKKRFAYDDNLTRIRAVQGHTVEVDLGYEPKEPPEELYHGTTGKNLDAIFDNGIKSMKRQDVHLSADMATAMQVGARHGKPVILMVHAREMHKAGHKFYQAPNGVWLCDEVPKDFIYVC